MRNRRTVMVPWLVTDEGYWMAVFRWMLTFHDENNGVTMPSTTMAMAALTGEDSDRRQLASSRREVCDDGRDNTGDERTTAMMTRHLELGVRPGTSRYLPPSREAC